MNSGDYMDWKSPLAKITGNYRALDKKALDMKKSWDDVEKLVNSTVPRKKKKAESTENKK